MNLSLLLPAGLAALVALAVPLLIHLARRSEQHPTDFAALRWLRERPKPRHRLRFDEWPLLVSRLMLLALLALFLAMPVLFDDAGERAAVVTVPGVDVAQVRALAGVAAEIRWLAPGFPPFDQPQPAGPLPFASLLRQFDAELAPKATLTVFVPAQLQGDAELPRLSRAVAWRVVPGAVALSALRSAPPALTVRYAASHAGALRYLRAAAKAWQVDLPAAPTTEALPASARALVWLAPGPLPATVDDWVRRGGTVLVGADTVVDLGDAVAYWRDGAGGVLVEGAARGRGHILRFARALTPAAMPQLLEPDFPQQLSALFVVAAPPSRVAARDYAPLAGGAAYAARPRDLQPWLALVIAALFVIERWLATRRRRAPAP